MHQLQTANVAHLIIDILITRDDYLMLDSFLCVAVSFCSVLEKIQGTSLHQQATTGNDVTMHTINMVYKYMMIMNPPIARGNI